MWILFLEEVLFSILNIFLYKKMLGIAHLPKMRTFLMLSISTIATVFVFTNWPENIVSIVVIAFIDMGLYLYWVSYFGLSYRDSLLLIAIASIIIKPPLMIPSGILYTAIGHAFGIAPIMKPIQFVIAPFISIILLWGATQIIDLSRIMRFMFFQKIFLKNTFITIFFLLVLASILPIEQMMMRGTLINIVDVIGYCIFLVLIVFEFVFFKIHLDNKRTKENYERQMKYIEDFQNVAKTYQSRYLHNKEMLNALINDEVSAPSHDNNHLSIMNNLSNLDNRTLAAFVYSQYMIACRQNIQFSCDIESKLSRTHFSDYKLIEIFGILINNAIEATLQTSSPEVHIHIANRSEGTTNNLSVQVVNISKPITPNFIQNLFVKKTTTNSNNTLHRGIGLIKLKQLISSYGDIFVDYNDQTQRFTATVEFKVSDSYKYASLGEEIEAC